MSQSATAEQCLNALGSAIIAENWPALHELLAPDNLLHTTPDDLERIFGWKILEPLLRTDWSVQTGEPDDPTNPLAPPVRFRHYPVSQTAAGRCELLGSERQPVFPPVDVTRFDDWHELVFEPADDSGFDVSYQCEVALVETDGRLLVGAFLIGNVLD